MNRKGMAANIEAKHRRFITAYLDGDIRAGQWEEEYAALKCQYINLYIRSTPPGHDRKRSV